MYLFIYFYLLSIIFVIYYIICYIILLLIHVYIPPRNPLFFQYTLFFLTTARDFYFDRPRDFWLCASIYRKTVLALIMTPKCCPFLYTWSRNIVLSCTLSSCTSNTISSAHLWDCWAHLSCNNTWSAAAQGTRSVCTCVCVMSWLSDVEGTVNLS